MKKEDTKISRLRDLAQRTGILHARELSPLGIPQRYLGRLCAEGFLVRTGHGLYMTSIGPETMHLGLAQAAKAVPKGVICLLSALRFHEIGTQVPHQVWIAMDRRSARPRVTHPRIQIVRFSGKSLEEGIGEHDIAGTRVRIYNPAKTVADCFKYRNKIGLDVALESLREAIRGRKCTADDLWRYAQICRVSKVMRPYMEAIL
jgi:predicted transcriptional regulator of viral defense system